MKLLSATRRRLQIATGLALLATFSPLAWADLYDDYINSASKRPFVTFLARSGVPGHAFVAVGVELNAGLYVYERFFGFYPKDGGTLDQVKLVFSKTSGQLDYKWKDTSWTTSYRVFMNEAQRKDVFTIVNAWTGAAPKYSLTASGGKNCNVFAAEVAKAIGLKVPDGAGSTPPAVYIQKLQALNAR